MTQNQHGLAFKLHLLVRLMDRAADDILQKELGVSYRQFLVLMVISGEKRPSQRHVAVCLEITPAAVSRHAGVLERLGYIKRSQHPNSRREHDLSLTVEGVAKLNQAKQILGLSFDDLLQGISKNDMRLFEEVVDQTISKLHLVALQSGKIRNE